MLHECYIYATTKSPTDFTPLDINNSVFNFTDIGFLILISFLLIYTYFKLKSNQKKWKYDAEVNKEESTFNFTIRDVLMQPKSIQNIEVNISTNHFSTFSFVVKKGLRIGLRFLHFLAIILALFSIAFAIDFILFLFL